MRDRATRRLTDARPRRESGGGRGRAVAPPRYGIDLADNRTGMPERLKAGVESLSGMDLSDVRVHFNSDKPAQLAALAYAQGNDIHLGPGQERSLPHEAWHVVQQRQGRVRPTTRVTGQPVNDDPALEREAQAMGERAAGAAGRTPQRPAHVAAGAGRDVVQRDLGFELEVPDWRVKKGMPFTRGLIQWNFFLRKNLHLIDGAGWYLQCDTLGPAGFDPEFVVSHVPDNTTAPAFTAIVAPMIALITAMENWNRGEEIPLSEMAGGGLNLREPRAIVDRHGFQFRADPQVNVGIDFNRLEEFFNDIATTAPASNAALELGRGAYFPLAQQQAQALLPGGRSGAYKSIVALMAHYIARGRRPAMSYTKQATEIMARTNFGAAYLQTAEAAAALPAATFLQEVLAVADAVLGGVGLAGGDLVFEAFNMQPDIQTWVNGVRVGNDALSSPLNPDVDTSMGALGVGQAGAPAAALAAMVLELREAQTQLTLAQLLPFMLNVLAHINALHAAAAGVAAPAYGATAGGLGAAAVAPRAQPWRLTKRLRTFAASLGF